MMLALLPTLPPGNAYAMCVAGECVNMYLDEYLPCKRGDECPEEANPYYVVADFLTLSIGRLPDGQRFYTCAEIEHIIRTELMQYPGHAKYTISLFARHNTVSAYAKPHGTAVYMITAQSIAADGRSIEYICTAIQ
jgi:hypothetical protein